MLRLKTKTCDLEINECQQMMSRYFSLITRLTSPGGISQGHLTLLMSGRDPVTLETEYFKIKTFKMFSCSPDLNTKLK